MPDWVQALARARDVHRDLAIDDQANLAAAIRGSRDKLYPHAGHALHWEEPARFAADLARFVATLPGVEAASDAA